MSKNILYVIIAILVLAAIILGYGWYSEANKPASVSVDLGGSSVTLDNNGATVNPN